ncbi:MAG: chemotaxis protein CheW [Candidatus Kapaibacterium sp.]|nr:chemotaxis protein CheW [Bacteroidota bacterium]
MNMTENDTTVEETLQLVSFSLGSEEFGIDILSVQEINRVSSITRVPNAPKYVVGVINLRGKIIPVVDLRKRFSMPSIATTEHSRIIVVELDTRVVGFLVDSVRHVLHVPKSIIEPTPPMVGDIKSEYITGIARLDGTLLTLLDLEKILVKQEVVL